MNGHDLLRGSRRIDPFAAEDPGRYADGLVEVVRIDGSGFGMTASTEVVRTRHFRLCRVGERLEIGHVLPPERLDNDLATLLAHELFAPGWLNGADVFERVFTGVVKTTVDDPVEAWSLFYGNTFTRIREGWEGIGAEPSDRTSIDEIVPVYRRVSQLVPAGRVLDLGCCFGFLAMLLAERPDTEVIASDIADGTVKLLRSTARKRGLSLGTLVCDGARVPLPNHAVDTVTAVHLLEHVEPEHGSAVLAEALRLARRRVIVAVPFEVEPTAAYGHVRTFDLAQLTTLGRSTGLPFHVDEHHGGWLVVECGDTAA